MENRRLALSLLLFSAVLVSGCVDNGSTEQESGGAITVTELKVQPKQIYEGTSVRVSMDIRNTGNLPATVYLGEDGERILKDRCPDIFSIADDNGFTVSTSGDYDGAENQVSLQPGRTLNLGWRLEQEGRVPLIGYDCNLAFEVPFNYSVEAFRQVQVKRTRDSAGSPELQSKSSSGPLKVLIETIGSSAEEGQSTFIAGEDAVTVLVQLRNSESENYAKGLVDVQESTFRITATEPLQLDEGFSTGQNPDWDSSAGEEKCGVDDGEEIRMFEGDSRVISCNLGIVDPASLDAPAMISEITAGLNYAYIKDAGTVRVRVETRGN